MKIGGVLGFVLGGVAFFVVIGCQKEKSQVFRVPKETLAVQVRQSHPNWPIFWTAPSHWVKLDPVGMRLGSYGVLGTGGQWVDISVTAFPGETGGMLANVNRWRTQIDLSPIKKGEEKRFVRNAIGKKRGVRLVQLKGHQKSMLVGLILHQGMTYFIKCMGPTSLVFKEKKVFYRFVDSFSFES